MRLQPARYGANRQARRQYILLPLALSSLLFGHLVAGTPTTHAQRGNFFLRYTGTVEARAGGGPLPAGTRLTLITARSATDLTICGSGAVSDGRGTYVIDVQPLPDCAASGGPRNSVQYYFVYNGVIETDARSNAALDRPESWGDTAHRDVSVTVIPGVEPTDLLVDADGTPYLPLFRLYGRVLLGDAQQPAPIGSEITVTTADSGILCGTGTVNTADGWYYVDVQPVADCAAQTGPGLNLVEFDVAVNGQSIGPVYSAKQLDLQSGPGGSPSAVTRPGGICQFDLVDTDSAVGTRFANC